MPLDERAVAAVAALDLPLRQRVYEYVADRGGDVTRDEVAGAVGVPRSVAAFHLDRLAAVGLLDVEYRRPPGREGPGAGRPAKWYRRSQTRVGVSVPPRNYELLARVLARSVARALADGDGAGGGGALWGVVERVAREEGRAGATAAWGEPDGGGGGPRSGGRRLGLRRRSRAAVARLVALAERWGYEPVQVGRTVLLRNCPFAELVAGDVRCSGGATGSPPATAALVCRTSHAWFLGAAEALALPSAVVVLDPAPGRCCVAFVAPGARRDRGGSATR